jgi:hypothetical protein
MKKFCIRSTRKKYPASKKAKRKRKTNWIGHTLRRNCLLKHVIEVKVGGTIEVTGRRGRRHKQVLDYLKEGENTGN